MHRLIVVGAGLLGTSIGLAARRAWPDAEIVGVDRRASRGPCGPFDRILPGSRELRLAAPDPARALPDLVVLACPVGEITGWLPRLAATLPPGTPVTDVGSTKRTIVAAARRSGLRRFVGGHPMAGGTRPGPRDARADLCAGRPWLLVPPTGGRAEGRAALEAVLDLVAACDARPVLLPSAAAHDRLVAAISHLPQLVATALMIEAGEAVGADALALAGGGLRDTTRLAASDAAMWASLLASNADLVAPRLRALAVRLDRFADAIDDPRRVADAFARANRWRTILERRTGHL